MKTIKILLITNLYPGYEGQSRKDITYAIHDIYKNIENIFSLKIIRVWNYFPTIFNVSSAARKKRKFALEKIFNIDGVYIHRIPIKSVPYMFSNCVEKEKVAKRIIEICNKEKYLPNIVICHMIEPSFEIGRIISLNYKIPIILALHNSDLKILRDMKNTSKFNCNGLVFRSDKIKNNALKYLSCMGYKFDKERLFVLNSGIKLDKIVDKSKYERKINKKNRKYIVVSNLESKSKMVEVVIKAYKEMETTDTTLTIIGGGKLRASLEKEAGNKNDIIFLGDIKHEEVLIKFEEADVFVLVSKNETFGLVYIEAMSKGCIAIGSENEGIDGFIRNKENGYLCKAGNTECLISIMKECYNMTIEKKRDMLERSISTIKKNSQETILSRYEDYIKTIIALG